ncbi:hypothetical protein VNI00_009713 [Paramarasmius palmivorus]|uniref:Uncharacterized protein n=1 Tax=Paramarasmius palmivorus TaxID=297713 RepID=A0AAW0CPD8_9AGAR
MAGASMEFSFVGTALYVYGSATSASYTISIDGVDVYEASAATVPQGGLLGSKTDLSYGSHTAKLTMVEGTQVEFQHAVLTIGVGYKGGSAQTYRNTIFAVTKSGNDERRNDAFFNFNPAPSGEGCSQWFVEGLIGSVYPASGSPEPVPRQMVASCPGGSLVFKVNQTSAFFIYGVVNNDHQWKTVTLRPGLNGESSKTTRYNDFSTVLDFRQVLHWESGLERDQEYEVEIVNEGGFGTNFMSFHTLQLIDGGSRPSNSLGGSSSNSTTTADKATPSGGLGAGAIAGIVVGVLLAVIAALLAAYFMRRRRRDDRVTRNTSKAQEFDTPYTYMATPFEPSEMNDSSWNMSLDGTRQSTPVPGVPLRANDAGPAFLPPEYNEAWSPSPAGSSEPSRSVRSLPIPPGSRKQ